jgi:uncharacterized protein YjbJ (UPF0337 family)
LRLRRALRNRQARSLVINLTVCFFRRTTMDHDRIKGAADQAKGSMKDAAGKITGDSKLQAEGKMDKAKGKIENAVGGAKDTMRDELNKH